MNRLIYILDPMCSWCYAFHPVFTQITNNHPDLSCSLLMGGLAPDSSEPMPMELQKQISQAWMKIEGLTGLPFNHQFWEKNIARRSTYPACRAVLAAEQLQTGSGIKMVEAIQQAYYRDALNPSDLSTLQHLATSIRLNNEQFTTLINSEQINKQLEQQIDQVRNWGVNGFPTLILQKGEQLHLISNGYANLEMIENAIEQLLRRE